MGCLAWISQGMHGMRPQAVWIHALQDYQILLESSALQRNTITRPPKRSELLSKLPLWNHLAVSSSQQLSLQALCSTAGCPHHLSESVHDGQ